MISLYPHWMIKLLQSIGKLISPIPATEWDIRNRNQMDVELFATKLSKEIATCSTLEKTYRLTDEIYALPAIWGHTNQVRAQVESLMLELRNKQNEILSKK